MPTVLFCLISEDDRGNSEIMKSYDMKVDKKSKFYVARGTLWPHWPTYCDICRLFADRVRGPGGVTPTLPLQPCLRPQSFWKSCNMHVILGTLRWSFFRTKNLRHLESTNFLRCKTNENEIYTKFCKNAQKMFGWSKFYRRLKENQGWKILMKILNLGFWDFKKH